MQGRYRAAALDAGQSLDVANLLTSPVARFAYGLTKVHKTAQDLIRQLDYTLWVARWAPLCLFFDPISDSASKAMGTHARHTLTFLEMVSPQLLVFLVITSGAFSHD